MLCTVCRFENRDDARFCINCGHAQDRRCPVCARSNPLIARFCGECGTVLSEAATAVPAAPSADISPPTVRRSIPALLREGERKVATILFADINESTRLIAELDPEVADRRLHTVIDAMRSAVTRFEGAVVKLQGDGFMALFGTPIPHEDHALRACCAALTMRDAVEDLGLEGAPVRIGLHTGEVIVRAVDNDMSTQFDAMGINVHIAARMEQVADPLSIRLSGDTVRAAGGLIHVDSLGPMPIKGLADPFEVFALKGIRTAVASEQFRGGQRLSPFVGRELELALLERAMRDAAVGRSRVVGVVGEAGAGKSRLLFEMTERYRTLNVPILESRATERSAATPLQPVLELLRAYFSIRADMSGEEAAQRLLGRMSAFGLSEFAAPLLSFLGLPGLAGPDSLEDSATRRARLLDSFGKLVRAAARHQTSLVVIEDLHWLDAPSQPFVDALVRGATDSTTLVVVDFRPGYKAEWMESASYEQISLMPLASAALDQLLRDSLGEDPSTAELGRDVLDRAAGNPFFAEELVRSLVDNGVLGGTYGNRHIRAGANLPALSNTIRDVLGSRLDRLPDEEKLVMQAAAIVGREFPAGIVRSVAEMDNQRAEKVLRRLVAAEMLYERAAIGGDEYAFKHPLLQEVAYNAILSERRRRLHRAAAVAFSREPATSGDEHASLVAHHWDRAEEPALAAPQYARAALWVGSRDPVQALANWRRVRALLADQSGTAPVDYMRMMAAGQIVNLSWREALDAESVRPIYEEAIGIARRLADARAAALITLAYGRALVATGSADDYVARVEEARGMLDKGSQPSVEALLLAVHGHALSTAGFLGRAAVVTEQALAQVGKIEARDRQTLGFEPKYWLWAHRARTLIYAGSALEAEPLQAALLDSPLETVDPLHRALACAVGIERAYLENDGPAALAWVERLHLVLAGLRTPYLTVLERRFSGLAALVAGDFAAAEADLQSALSYATSNRAGLEMEAFIRAALAEAILHRNKDAAAEAAQAALACSRMRSMRVAEALALNVQIRCVPPSNRTGDDARYDRLREVLVASGALALERKLSIDWH